jgi:hypothetical protein
MSPPLAPYQPSGKGAYALFPMYLVGAAGAILLALPYSRLIGFLFATAHVKVDGFMELFGWGVLLMLTWFVGAAGTGMLVGGLASGIGRALRCRTGLSNSVFFLALLLSATGLYAYYNGWVLQAQDKSVLQLLPPSEIWSHLEEHLKGRATNGKVFAGIFYGIEALFYYGGISAGLDHFLGRPYCEECGRWTTSHLQAERFRAPANETLQQNLVTELEAGRYAALRALGAPRVGEERCLSVDLHGCETCEHSHYLTVHTIKNPNQPEATGLQTAAQLGRLASPGGVVGIIREGAEEGWEEETLVTLLPVDGTFARSLLSQASPAG